MTNGKKVSTPTFSLRMDPRAVDHVFKRYGSAKEIPSTTVKTHRVWNLDPELRSYFLVRFWTKDDGCRTVTVSIITVHQTSAVAARSKIRWTTPKIRARIEKFLNSAKRVTTPTERRKPDAERKESTRLRDRIGSGAYRTACAHNGKRHREHGSA